VDNLDLVELRRRGVFKSSNFYLAYIEMIGLENFGLESYFYGSLL
jgi:hypothetical protein